MTLPHQHHKLAFMKQVYLFYSTLKKTRSWRNSKWILLFLRVKFPWNYQNHTPAFCQLRMLNLSLLIDVYFNLSFKISTFQISSFHLQDLQMVDTKSFTCSLNILTKIVIFDDVITHTLMPFNSQKVISFDMTA